MKNRMAIRIHFGDGVAKMMTFLAGEIEFIFIYSLVLNFFLKDLTTLDTIYHDIRTIWDDTGQWTTIHRSEIPCGNSFDGLLF